MAIEAKAHARAGFLGNPSDGYFGKTISIALENFAAHVSLDPTDELRIEAHDGNPNSYKSVEDLVHKVGAYGYYGGERLLKAAIKKFHDYCASNGIGLKTENFTMTFRSSIPRQVGLGGSSAIVTAAMSCLMKFYDVAIPMEKSPSLTLDAEAVELGINAGLQDRVIQAYEGCMYMDFDHDFLEKNGHGIYERLDPSLLPPLFIAYKTGLGKISGHALSGIRIGYDRGDRLVVDTLGRIAEIAGEGRQALMDGDHGALFELMNENFDRRSRIMEISDGNREMIETARGLGASAKFAGSGGSIIGIYKGDDMFEKLAEALGEIEAAVVKPVIAREDKH